MPPGRLHSFLLSNDSEWYFSVIALETWSITASEGTSVTPEGGLNLDAGFHAAAEEAAKVEAQRHGDEYEAAQVR